MVHGIQHLGQIIFIRVTIISHQFSTIFNDGQTYLTLRNQRQQQLAMLYRSQPWLTKVKDGSLNSTMGQSCQPCFNYGQTKVNQG
jgi:hypothetical protein